METNTSTIKTHKTSTSSPCTPGEQVDGAGGAVAPVDELVAVVPRVLEVAHGAGEVPLVGLQRHQPVNRATHFLLSLRVVLEQEAHDGEDDIYKWINNRSIGAFIHNDHVGVVGVGLLSTWK